MQIKKNSKCYFVKWWNSNSIMQRTCRKGLSWGILHGVRLLGTSKSGFPNPKKRFYVFLGKSKNWSRIHKIHAIGEFFGSNPIRTFQIHHLTIFFWKGFEKNIFASGFSNKKNGTQQMPYMYVIKTGPMLVAPFSHWHIPFPCLCTFVWGSQWG